MKLLRNIFLYLILFLILSVSGVVSYVYFNQDAIIARGIVEANKYLKAPVSVGKISLSLFDRFPQVAIKFENITIQESIPESKAQLLNAKKLYLSFDVIKVIQKQYVISEIHIANGNILVRTDSLGRHNFDIIKKDSTQKTQNKNQGFALKNISLEDVSVIYKNEGKHTEISLYTSKSVASLKNKKGFTEIALDGAFFIRNFCNLRLLLLNLFAGFSVV